MLMTPDQGTTRSRISRIGCGVALVAVLLLPGCDCYDRDAYGNCATPTVTYDLPIALLLFSSTTWAISSD